MHDFIARRPNSVTEIAQQEGLHSKLAREAELFGSLPGHLKEGLVDNLSNLSSDQIIKAVAQGAIMGVATGFLLRNPKSFGGVGQFIAEHPKLVLGTAVGTDLLTRAGAPAVDTWNNPQNLETDKKWLGSRFASMATDYPLMALGGGLGSSLAKSTSSLSRSMADVLGPRSNLAFETSAARISPLRPTFSSASSESSLWPNVMESRALSQALDRPIPNGRGRIGGRANDAATGPKLVEMPVTPLEEVVPVVDIIKENASMALARGVGRTSYGKLDGKLMFEGRESWIIDTGDPAKVLKITDPLFPEIEPRKLQWFDAKRYGQESIDGEAEIYMQERLTPDVTQAELEDFVYRVEKNGKWLFSDAKPSQVGRRANGELALMDTGAVRARTAEAEDELLSERFTGGQYYRGAERDDVADEIDRLIRDRFR